MNADPSGVSSHKRWWLTGRWCGFILLLLGSGLWGSPLAQDGRGVSLVAVPEVERERLGFDAGVSTALFVGVQTFDDSALTSVPYAVDDAVDLAHLFAFDLALVSPRRVVLALSGDPAKKSSQGRLARLKQAGARVTAASKSKILGHLRRQSKAAGADGLFLVGLATHGFTKAGEDYLFAKDTLLAYPKETGLRVGLLFEALAEARTLRRFALLDACKERLGAARGSGQASPMGQAFHDAIAAAQGQVVLAATTTNGYAYDDAELQNGVFTAAILDGLRGAALDTGTSFVTAGALAEYVNRRVLDWVSQNRPSDRQTLGISRNIEGAGATLPLAADPDILQRTRDYQVRKGAAIDKLRNHLGGPLKGETYDRVTAFLDVDTPTDAHNDLLLEIESLDDSRRSKRRLAAYVKTYVSSSGGAKRTLQSEESQADLTNRRPETKIVRPGPVAPKPAASLMLPLTVETSPPGARVRILNIVPKYRDGMQLKPGEYRIEVTHSGYEKHLRWHALRPGSEELTVELEPKKPREPSRESSQPNVLAPSMVRIKGGCFQMGSPASEEERDDDERRHRVCVEDFKLGKYEVTQAQWYAVMENDPSYLYGCDACPVEQVSWNDVHGYINKLNARTGKGYRLPTEAEWEYACRGGRAGERYCGGNDVAALAWYYGNSGEKTHPVGGKRGNGFGLYDLSGNVWEWTCSAYDEDYSGGESQCVGIGDGGRRVIRGGSWYDRPRYVRAADRNGGTPVNRFIYIGFRLAQGEPD